MEVRLTSSDLIETEPGRIITATFLVSNNTSAKREFIEELELPPGWKPVLSAKPFLDINENQQTVRPFAFFVPYNAAPGNYLITYSVRGQSDPGIYDSESVTLTVLPVVRLELLVYDKPDTVIAGATYNVKIILLNKGNGKSTVRLDVSSTPDYPVKPLQPEITLSAGESKMIELEVSTDKDLKEVIKQVISITASAEVSEGEVSSVRRTVPIDVIPRVTGSHDPYHRVPARLSFIGSGEGDDYGYQMELSGSGSLDEENTKRIEFIFRGPDTSEKTIFGRREELRTTYYTEDLTLRLGDNSYSLSHLTDMYRFGRGAELNYHPGPFEAGAFYLKERWGEPRGKETGTHLGYQFNDQFEIKANYMNKQEGAFTDNMYSVQTELEPVRNIRFDLEYGLSDTDRENASRDDAYRIASIGQFSETIHYTFNKIHANADYFGYYNDSDTMFSTVTFPVYDKLRGHFSYRDYRNNLDNDIEKNTANKEETYRTGLSYTLPAGTGLSLEYKKTLREDVLLPAAYNYNETSIQFGVGHSFKNINSQIFMEKGQFEDRLEQVKNSSLERYTLYLFYTPTDRQNYSLYFNMGHDSFSTDPQRKKSASISTNLEITDDLSIYLRYAKDNFDSSESYEQDSIDSTINYTLPNRHSLQLKLRRVDNEYSGDDSAFFVMYSMPLKIPVGKKRSIGAIRGRVTDREKPGNPPIPNVIIKANEATAVTDENGDFIFPSLRPGTYSLWVDRSSIGLNRVTEEKLPITARIQGGETLKMNINVVNSCTISGSVTLSAINMQHLPLEGDDPVLLGSGGAGSGSNNDDQGLKNLLVQISDGKDVRQALTNSNGMFTFKGIRPGTWKIMISTRHLPEHHYIEKDNFEVELQPGTTENITVKVLPRRRPIRMIEEGEIISTTN